MEPQNLIVIMSDEHDNRYMGCEGHPAVKTPNIDKLAARGTRFTDAYTPCPICVPARAAFATGDYVHRIGYWDNAIAYEGRVPGWGHALQEAGVSVESIGKLHYRNDDDPVGFDREHAPMNIYNGHGMVWGSVRDPLPDWQPRGSRMLGDYIGGGESKYTEYDRQIAKLTVEWLQARARGGAPWCLYVGFVAPHFPLVVPQEFIDLYPLDSIPPSKLLPEDGHPLHPWVKAHYDFWPSDQLFEDADERKRAIAAYYGLCTWVDHNIGLVLDALDETGLSASTRVVYTSDHGDNVGARGLWGKSNLYQEAVHVPLIMAGPDIPVGVCKIPVTLLDLQPTILAGMGVAPPPQDAAKPGRSLFDIALLPDETERVVFSEYHAVGSPSGGFMIRKGHWKYHYYAGYTPELFDLDADPEETMNRADDPAVADVLADLHAELLKICDPDAVDAEAKRDQAALVESYGGREKARDVGAPGATPAPGV